MRTLEGQESDFPLQPYWEAIGGVGQLTDLLKRLEATSGILLSPDRLLRLADIMRALSARGMRITRSQEAAAVLLPLLVTSGEAQLIATAEIDGFWSPALPPKGSIAEAATTASKTPLVSARLRIAFISAILLLIVMVAAWVMLRHPIEDVAQSVPVPQSEVTSEQGSFRAWLFNLLFGEVIHRLFGFFAVSIFALLWWKSKKASQVRLSRARSEGSLAGLLTVDTNITLFPTSLVRRAGRLLRRPVKVRGSGIDVSRTIWATIEAGGFFRLIPGIASRIPDCLILVDRISRDDHLSALASSLTKRLRDGGADLLRYDFRTYPEVLEAVGRRYGGQAVLSLKAVARRHPGSRVIVVSTGRGFFEPFNSLKPRLEKPFFGEPDHAGMVAGQPDRRRARVLPSFGDSPILLTPTPSDRWGPREQTLSNMGFTVIPFGDVEGSTSGLFSAVEAIIHDRKSSRSLNLVARYATPAEDPLMVDLERVELLSDTPPRDPIYRKKLASRVLTYATKHLSVMEAGAARSGEMTTANAELEARAAFTGLLLFPKVSPNLTPQIWAAITGCEPGAALLSRLSRLPWFRSGHVPDWLRADVASSFQTWLVETQQSEERWHELRAQLAAFATGCLNRAANAESVVVYRRSTVLNSAWNDLKLILRETSPADRAFIEDRLFLTFVESGTVVGDDLLSVELRSADRPTGTMLLGLATFGVVAAVAAIFLPWALRLFIGAGYQDVFSGGLRLALLAMNCLVATFILLGPPLKAETLSGRAVVAVGAALAIAAYPFYVAVPSIFPLTILPALTLVLLALPLLWPPAGSRPLISCLFDGDTSGLEFAAAFAAAATLVLVGYYEGFQMAFLISFVLLLAFSRYSDGLWAMTAMASYALLFLSWAAFLQQAFPSVSTLTWAAPAMMAFAGFAAKSRTNVDSRNSDLKFFSFVAIAHIAASMLAVSEGGSSLLGTLGNTIVPGAVAVYVVAHTLIGMLSDGPSVRAIRAFDPVEEFFHVGTVAGRSRGLAYLEIAVKALIFGFILAALFRLTVRLADTLPWLISLRVVIEFLFISVTLFLFRADGTFATETGRGWLWLAFPALFLMGVLPPKYYVAIDMELDALAYLTLPAAVFIGNRWGRNADRPILFGLFPFLFAVRSGFWVTLGGIWIVLVAFMIKEVARSGSLGEVVLGLRSFLDQRSSISKVAVATGTLLLLSFSVYPISGTGFVIDPEPMRLMLLVLLGIAGVASWPILVSMLLVTTVSLGLMVVGVHQRLGDTHIAMRLLNSDELLNMWMAFLAMPVATFCWRSGSASRAPMVVQGASAALCGVALAFSATMYSTPAFVILYLKGPFTIPLLAWMFGVVSLWTRPTSASFWLPGIAAGIAGAAIAMFVIQQIGFRPSPLSLQMYAPDALVFIGFAVFGYQSAKVIAAATGQVSAAPRTQPPHRNFVEDAQGFEGVR